jgi:L-threonylcarbamoyladenylate synthase
MSAAAGPHSIASAAQQLADGKLLGMPTETVYGLAARADHDAAVLRIFAAKGRPLGHPLILHVHDTASAVAFAADWPAVAQRLVAQFWPGPLTVIVRRRPELACAAAANLPTVGLRCPDHPMALAVLQAARQLGVLGVAAPSANRFGRISPTTAAHVATEFGTDLMVLDGGACQVGIESSIVDCSRGAPVLLRPGILTRAQLEAAAGQPLLLPSMLPNGVPQTAAPGTLPAHYAPRAKLRLMPTSMLQSALEVLGDAPAGVAVYSRTLAPNLVRKRPHRFMPDSAVPAAQALFSALRELDTQPGVELIWVEAPPSEPAWEGVHDRLQRAAAASI